MLVNDCQHIVSTVVDSALGLHLGVLVRSTDQAKSLSFITPSTVLDGDNGGCPLIEFWDMRV